MLSSPLSSIAFIIIGVLLLTVNGKLLSELKLFGGKAQLPGQMMFWKNLAGGILILLGILGFVRDIFFKL